MKKMIKKTTLSVLTLSILMLAGFNIGVYSFGKIKIATPYVPKAINEYKTQSLEDRIKILNIDTEVDLNNIQEYAKMIKDFGEGPNYLDVKDNDKHLMVCFMAKQLKNTKICVSNSQVAFTATAGVLEIRDASGVKNEIFGNLPIIFGPETAREIEELLTDIKGVFISGKVARKYINDNYSKSGAMPHNIKFVIHRKFVEVVVKDMIRKFGSNFSLINTYNYDITGLVLSHECIHKQMEDASFFKFARKYIYEEGLTSNERKIFALKLGELPYYKGIGNNSKAFVDEVGTQILTPKGWTEAEISAIPQMRAIVPLLKKHHLPMKKYMIKHGHTPIEVKW